MANVIILYCNFNCSFDFVEQKRRKYIYCQILIKQESDILDIVWPNLNNRIKLYFKLFSRYAI